MTLSALIRKRDTESVATAIPASFATQPEREAATVARIATVAVANPENEKTAPLQSADAANDEADEAAHFAWLIHFTDRAPVAVTFSPMLDHAGVLAYYPDAVAAEPVRHRQPEAGTLTDQDERRILAWLDHSSETDSPTIGEVIDRCRSDPEARRYFLARSSEDVADDRRLCAECSNERAGICTIARPSGLVSAQRGYRPAPIKHRCAGFAERGGAD